MIFKAFLTFRSGSQVFSSCGYPFQCIRYSSAPLLLRESRTSSTSYSFSPSISSGGGGGGLSGLVWVGGMYGVRSDSLNTRWVFLHEVGNLSS